MGLLVGNSVEDSQNMIEVFPAMVFYMSGSSRIERSQTMSTDISFSLINSISYNLNKERSPHFSVLGL